MITVCIGLNLAQMELRAATVRFFKRFPNARVSTLHGFTDKEMEQVVYFIMYPRGKRCLISDG
jgi:cytochrome P450